MRNVCLCLAVILVVFVIPGMASGGNVPAAGDRLVDMRLPPPPVGRQASLSGTFRQHQPLRSHNHPRPAADH
jgi:hypothetical protein